MGLGSFRLFVDGKESENVSKLMYLLLVFVCNMFSAYEEVEAALLLVLVCAVHCDRRETFIANIQRLPVDLQEAIVDCIKQVNLAGSGGAAAS